jgi:class 3 adenylate cyclase
VTAVLCCKKRYRPAVYYLISCLASLAGFIGYNLMYSFQILPFSMLLYFLPNIGVMITAILLPLAVVERVKKAEAQKAEAEQQLIASQRRSMNDLQSVNVSLSRFVPTKFISLLGKERIDHVNLGDYIQATMTVLFSDIRSFTSISERMSPQENFQFINRYLEGVGPIIRRRRGFIDKFIGDGIMALFPNRASDAVGAAVDMQKHLADFNQTLTESSLGPIRIGIGIHTGTMILGTIGEKYRMDGTVISDAVNLSSRLESLTKKHHASIIVSSDIIDELKTSATPCYFRTLGVEAVKGRQGKASVYEILDSLPEAVRERRVGNIPIFEKGVALYLDGNNRGALKQFEETLKTDPTDFSAQLFIERIRNREDTKEILL